MKHLSPIYVGYQAPYLDINATGEFICLPCCPVWEVIRILDLSWPMPLDGRGGVLPRGAEPCWLTVERGLSKANCLPFRNSKNEMFVPCLT